MGAQQSKSKPENEFVFENPLLQTTTFELPKNDEINNETTIDDSSTKNDNANVKEIPETNNNNNNNNNNNDKSIPISTDAKLETEDNNIENIEVNSVPLEEEVKEVKKDKKIKFEEEPIPVDDNSYKPLNLEEPDIIITPDFYEEIIEEHVKEEINNIKNDPKVRNFKRDKLLERTINIIKFGNTSNNFNYKDINDKYRKSQKRVLECISNNSSYTLSERDIACYQEFEEFKDSIRMLYRKYYNANN
ncbi:hypothetical protein BCR32DRAFT_327264 [Anaeromyces robustus]|uniref:Uncharacterized protein n=1 Tax=Anaeromyces robustus TaxID=1754192 RepID=A0A1Y1X6X5_9FUNG|nr:hypothetical protein BCR32DRAFT_327264 [Anaeromyces robustus]|eukprot:ORX81543.1 hypothetical protein BCR32DRAFT_327264 [Anaeromyces robustus]